MTFSAGLSPGCRCGKGEEAGIPRDRSRRRARLADPRTGCPQSFSPPDASRQADLPLEEQPQRPPSVQEALVAGGLSPRPAWSDMNAPLAMGFSTREASAHLTRIAANIGQVMHGQHETVRRLLAGFGASGHVLLELRGQRNRVTLHEVGERTPRVSVPRADASRS